MLRLSRVKYRDNMPHPLNLTTTPKFAKQSIERSQFAIFISFANLNGADYGPGTLSRSFKLIPTFSERHQINAQLIRAVCERQIGCRLIDLV